MSIHKKKYHIAIVAGEASGDLLASKLIKEIKKSLPNVTFSGIAGPNMVKAGCVSLVPNFKFGIMGFHQVFIRLFHFMYAKYKLVKFFKKNHPDLFIGIDFTEFNLYLAKSFKKLNVKTIQYKGPSVWAWRQSRIKKVKKHIDLILTIFPFEQQFYEKHNVNAKYIGHMLAQQIPFENDRNYHRKKLDLDPNQKIIALLPGSRTYELNMLGPIFLQTVKELISLDPELKFVVGLVNEEKAHLFNQIAKKNNFNEKLDCFVGKTPSVIAASDFVLVVSGTATLEVMLYKKPMVVVYKVNKFYGYILKKMLKTAYIALPNLLANREIVPELYQEQADPKIISKKIIQILGDVNYQTKLRQHFETLHKKLYLDTNTIIRDTILENLKE